MTEETTTPATPAAAADDVVVAAAQVVDDKGVLAEGMVAVQGDHALIVARFADTKSAIAIYDNLLAAEIDGSLEIDGVLVAKADSDGRIHIQKMTEHSTRKGLKWGIVGGVVAGIFLPATIVGGAVALGFAGAAAGKARNLYHRVEVEKELADVITPGTSGILCLVTAAQVEDVRLKMPDAQEVKTVPVDAETADAIKAAAAAADSAAPAADAEAPAAG
jgi:uncharacterized membrane protein